MMAVPWVLVEWLVQDLEDLEVLAPGVQEDLCLVQEDLCLVQEGLEDLAIWALMVQWGWDQDLQVVGHPRVQDRE